MVAFQIDREQKRFTSPRMKNGRRTALAVGVLLLLSMPACSGSDDAVPIFNFAPTATAQNLATDEDVALGVTLAGTDVEGSALTYAVATQPAYGNLTGAAPALTYTPNPNYNGSDSFTFTSNDGTEDSAAATVSLTVNPVNDAPQGTGQAVATDEDVALGVTLAGTDVEGSALTYAVATQPAYGNLTGAAPALTYTPNPNYNGLDSFTFTANDGTVDSALATVDLTVNSVNDPPQITGQAVATDEDVALGVTLAGTDVEGSALTYAVATQPAYGNLTGAAPALTYTPNPNYNGSDSFTFTANDGTVDSVPATVDLTVNSIADAPVAIGQSRATTVDAPLNLTLTGSDGDGDPLTFVVDTSPTNGVLTGTEPALTYTPNASFAGVDSFIFTADDGSGPANPATIHLNIVGGFIHVAATGNDSNAGTDVAPMLTLQAAIAKADTDFTSSVVKVAGGTYAFDSNTGVAGDNAINMAEGVSLFGGYNPADFNDRDPVVFITTIDDTNVDDTGSQSLANLNRTVHAAAGITTATIVEGFTIQAGDGDYNSAILMQSGSPTFRGNTILGGDNLVIGSSNSSSGFFLFASTAVIEDNAIHGGMGGQFSHGISLFGGSPTILRNRIESGDSNSGPHGITVASGSSPFIANNTIQAGVGTTSAYGIIISLSNGVVILNNTIYSSRTGISMFSSDPDIRNNIIFALNSSTTCINEENPNTPVSVRNNDLYGCVTLYRDEGTIAVTDLTTAISTAEGSDTLGNFDNVSVDPVLVDAAGPDANVDTTSDNDWHLTVTSPASVTLGGLDLSGTFTTDKDNAPRTGDGSVGWSMGAYEQ